MDVIERIPPELLTEVFKYLSAKDLTSCAQVCAFWNQVAHQFELWVNLYRKMIPHVPWLDGPLARLVERSRIEEYMTKFDSSEVELRRCVDLIEKFFLRLNSKTLHQTSPRLPGQRLETNMDRQCTMLGPAIDQPDFSEAFFRSLLRWVDVETCGRFLSENVPVRGSTNAGWAGLGLPLRLPSYSSHDGNSFRLIILHARDKATRSTLPYGGNRIAHSSLMTSDSSDPGQVKLTQEALCTVRQSSSIVYTVDLRAPDEESALLDPTPEDRWMQMRLELKAITSVMTTEQKLLVLGLYETTHEDLPVYCQPFEIVRKLGGAVQSDDHIQPLIDEHLVWRMWCTRADQVNAVHLEQIFSWLICEDEEPKTA